MAVREDAPRARSTALDVALRALAVRARSEKEIVDRLEQRGFSQREIAEAMAELVAYALLDDKAFAEQWAERGARQGLGPYRIARTLREKGVDAQTAREALDTLDADAEEASACALAERYLRREGKNVRQRAQAALARRGFGYDVIRRVLDAAEAAMAEEDEA